MATTTAKPVSTAAFIKGLIKERKLSDEKILARARKRAPEQKIGDHYVSWYRRQMKQQKK